MANSYNVQISITDTTNNLIKEMEFVVDKTEDVVLIGRTVSIKKQKKEGTVSVSIGDNMLMVVSLVEIEVVS